MKTECKHQLMVFVKEMDFRFSLYKCKFCGIGYVSEGNTPSIYGHYTSVKEFILGCKL